MMGLLNHQRVGQRGKYALEFNGTTGQGGTGQAFDILSYWRPSLGRSAGARLTVIRRAGSASPDATRAARTRSRASDTALSGRPTTLNAGSPGATWTWTSTARASMPSNATVATRWTMPTPASRMSLAHSYYSGKNN